MDLALSVVSIDCIPGVSLVLILLFIPMATALVQASCSLA